MNSTTAQIVIVIAVVIAAAAYLGWRIWRRIAGPNSASGCGTCPQSSRSPSAGKDVMISLDSLTNSAEKLSSPRD